MTSKEEHLCRKAALTHKSGTLVHVHITAVRHSQNPTALTCILENQTALVGAEERLKQAADRLRNIVPSEGEKEQLSLEMMLEVMPVLVERHRALFELCMVGSTTYFNKPLRPTSHTSTGEYSERILAGHGEGFKG